MKSSIAECRFLMGQIKCRLLDAIDLAEALQPGETTYQHEYVALHIRKLLEQIAYSSLIVNRSAYLKHYPKLANEWRPTEILKLIEKINPKFYPLPVEPTGSQLVAVKDGFISRSDFEFLYKKTHELLHTPHPNKPLQDESQWRCSPSSWLAMIGNLLKLHVMRVAESDQILIIELGPLGQGPRITAAVYESEI